MIESYRELFNVMNIKKVIIIEDSFHFSITGEIAVEDFLRLSDEDRRSFIDGLYDKNPELVGMLEKITGGISDLGVDIHDVDEESLCDILNDWKRDDLLAIIEDVDSVIIQVDEDWVQYFGIGLSRSGIEAYKTLLREISYGPSGPDLRVCKNYRVQEKKAIRNELQAASEQGYYVAIFVDNDINSQKMGDKIIEDLDKDKNSKWAVPILYTSFPHKELAINPKGSYVECVNKRSADVEIEIRNALLRSQYSLMLKSMRDMQQTVMDQVYDEALKEMNIAQYLSAMARAEGTTNHEMISQWIRYKTEYRYNKEHIDTINDLKILSSLLDELNFKEPMDISGHTPEVQIFDNFDYSVNERMLPPMPGDIFVRFTKKKKAQYYLLTGQECDHIYRNGKKRSHVGELLKINEVEADVPISAKAAFFHDKVILNYFEGVEGDKVTSPRPVSVLIGQPELVDHEILDLCAFNKTGKCGIDQTEMLSVRDRLLLPREWGDYYVLLQNYFRKIIENEEALETVFNLFNTKLGKIYNKRIVSVGDMSTADGQYSFELMRVCRLKKYMGRVNRLLNEHRTREGDNTVNFDSRRPERCHVVINGKPKGISCRVWLDCDRENNRGYRPLELSWSISKDEFRDLISDLNLPDGYNFSPEVMGDDIVLHEESGILVEDHLNYSKRPTSNMEFLPDEKMRKSYKGDMTYWLHIEKL